MTPAKLQDQLQELITLPAETEWVEWANQLQWKAKEERVDET